MWPRKFKTYLQANPVLLPFLVFVVLLTIAAILSVAVRSDFAKELAIYAFYAFVIGVALEIWLNFRRRDKSVPDGHSDCQGFQDTKTVFPTRIGLALSARTKDRRYT